MLLYWSVTVFSNKSELSSLKANYTVVFFTVANHGNDRKKRTSSTERKTQNGLKSTNPHRL